MGTNEFLSCIFCEKRAQRGQNQEKKRGYKISGRSPFKNYFKFTDFLGVFEEVVHKG